MTIGVHAGCMNTQCTCMFNCLCCIVSVRNLFDQLNINSAWAYHSGHSKYIVYPRFFLLCIHGYVYHAADHRSLPLCWRLESLDA